MAAATSHRLHKLRPRAWALCVGLWVALAAGCAGHGQRHELMSAPALSEPEAASKLFGDVAPARRQHTVDLLYITDRAIEPKADTG